MTHPLRRWLATLFCFLGFYQGVYPTTSFGDQYLEALSDPIILELQTHLGSEYSREGDPFQAILKDDVHFYGATLPARTIFYGVVDKSKVGRRFYRKGYVRLAIQSVDRPGGSPILDVEKTGPQTDRLKADIDKKRSLYTYVKIPLSVVGFLTPFPIALGVRAVAGAAVGSQDKAHQDETLVKRMGRGIYNVSPIPSVVNLVKKQPGVLLKPGDPVALSLPEPVMRQLFYLEGPAS